MSSSIENALLTYVPGHLMVELKVRSLSVGAAILIAAVLSCFVNWSLIGFVLATLFLSTAMTPYAKAWIPKKKIAVSGKAVFITGCDRGFGYYLAKRLDNVGFHVFAGCLFPNGEGAEDLRKSRSGRMHVVSLDVTSDTSVQEAANYVKENLKNNNLWALVNNAGILSMGALHWVDMEGIRQMFDVNTLGAVRVSKAFLSMIGVAKGRVINVSSAAGRLVLPGVIPYSMTKVASLFFSEGLRLETHKWGIKIVSIEPTVYRTALNSPEAMRMNFNKAWEKAPQDVKDFYGPGYIDKYREKYVKLTESYINENVGDVVSVMEESITVEYPEESYLVGATIWQRLVSRTHHLLPKSFLRFLLLHSSIEKEFL